MCHILLKYNLHSIIYDCLAYVPSKCVWKYVVKRSIISRETVYITVYINDNTHVTSGSIPKICHILLKYNLHSIINYFSHLNANYHPNMFGSLSLNVSVISRETQLWDYRASVDTNFVFFRILHPCIRTCIIYKMCNRNSLRNTMFVISRLWITPVTLENRKCGEIYQE